MIAEAPAPSDLLTVAESMAGEVTARLDAVRRRIVDAGGDPERVAVVAVTKGFGPEAAVAAAMAGLGDVGENYADELLAKAEAVAAAGVDVRWHFLGALQTNKIARIAPHVRLWQTVDSEHRAAALAQRVPNAATLVQVDLARVAGRGGCLPEDTGRVVAAAREAGLDVRGLMGVAPDPHVAGAAANRAAFGALASLAGELGLDVLSMGMTQDLEAAVAQGSTMVRVGEALFGPRPPVGSAAGSSPPERRSGDGSTPSAAGSTTEERGGRAPSRPINGDFIDE